jgi:hypothetical protein
VYGAITVDLPVTVQSMNGAYFTAISGSEAVESVA